MRAVFVNYIHPETPHVSAMRVKGFAEALARKGHKIVLLTKTLKDDTPSKLPDEVRLELNRHDWNRPYHLACTLLPDKRLQALRMGKLSLFRRKAIITRYYLLKSGLFNDWVEGSRPYWPVLVDAFRPQVIWGTFGNTDTWFIAQGIAKMTRCPWVMDIKDGWDPFIPSFLRKLIARRFNDAAALTVNSQFQARLSRRWFLYKPVVIYSGVPDFFLKDVSADGIPEGFRLTLIGSTYSRKNLQEFMEGLRCWLQGLNALDRAFVTFAYAGGDTEAVKYASGVLQGLCCIELYPYLDLEKYFQLCRTSTVNAYLWTPRGFHHKLVELLCCRRPIISFPGEHNEAIELVKEVNGELFCCTTVDDLVCCLGRLWANRITPLLRVNNDASQRFSWDAQAEILARVLAEVHAKI